MASYRKRYLITYDVADDKRRYHIFKALEGFGDHTQFSVFICELNRSELAQLTGQLQKHVHHREDQVLVLDLGTAQSDIEHCLKTIGKAYHPPIRAMIV